MTRVFPPGKFAVVFKELNSFHPYVTLCHPPPVSHRGHLPDHVRGRRDVPGADAGGFVSRQSRFPSWWSPRFSTECRRSRSKPTSPDALSVSSRWPAGVDHIESRSLPGVSLIKIYFQPGFNPDSAVTSIANLAMADLRKLPPGTLPPVVLQFDASSLPVCLITLKGEGLNEAKLRDLGQYRRAQPGRQRAGRIRAAAVRRALPADHGLCGSAQIGVVSVERHGRGAHSEQRQSDSARRRREDRPLRLQYLCQQPAQ